jgi:hypothetical protein
MSLKRWELKKKTKGEKMSHNPPDLFVFTLFFWLNDRIRASQFEVGLATFTRLLKDKDTNKQ